MSSAAARAQRGPIFELLPGRLYLSGTWLKMAPERRAAELAARGITDVVNVGKVDDTWREYGVTYSYVYAPDSKLRVPEAALRRAGALLADGARRGAALAMCYGGRNRSAVIAALAIMQLEGVGGADALARVQAVKATTFLNTLYADWVRALSAP